MYIKYKKRILQVGRFLVSGGVGVLLYYAVLYLLTELCHVWYVASAVVASLVNYGANFILQKFWTFQNKNTKPLGRQLVLYFSLAVGILIANTFSLWLLVELAYWQYLVAQLPLTIVFTVPSYLFTKKIFAQ
ncbi:MAG: GtrA family protein [Candidatus Veblenbacteria bacterium]|nr:GtrA family protein [Candidatus Veblenbacteria bacterium]